MSVVGFSVNHMNPFRLTTRLTVAPRDVRASRSGHARTGADVGIGGGIGAVGGGSGDTAPATPVPWRVTRRRNLGIIEVTNDAVAPLRAARFTLAGGALIGLSLPRTVHPGESLRVVVRGVHAENACLAPDAMLVLRWFQPDGKELLWPIAL